MPKADSLLLKMVVILLLGMLVRLFRLDSQSIWFDEAARLIIARADIQTILLTTGGDTLPPLYHFLLHFWQTVGTQDFWTRLPSVFSSVLFISVMFQSGRMFFNDKVGIMAAGITTLLPYLVFHSQQANLYSQFTLLAGLQLIVFWKMHKTEPTRMTYIAYVFVNLAAMYTHYFAAFFLVASHLYLLIQKDVKKHILVADALIALGYLPYATIFVVKAQEVTTGFWLTSPSILEPFLTLYLFIGSYSLASTLFIVGLSLVLIMLTFSLLEIRHHLKHQPENRPIFRFLLLATFFPIAIVWIISQWLPIYLARTLLITLPSLILILAYAVVNTNRRSPLFYISGLTVCLLFISLYNYFESPDYWKPDYRAAATAVSSNHAPNNAIVHTGNGSYIPFLVYLPPTNHFLLSGDPAPHHPPNVHENVHGSTIEWKELNQFKTITLVVALDHSIDYQKEIVEQFDQTYTLLNSTDIDEITIRSYDISSEQ